MTDTIEPTEEQKQAARLHFYPADDHIDDATTLALARLLAEREAALLALVQHTQMSSMARAADLDAARARIAELEGQASRDAVSWAALKGRERELEEREAAHLAHIKALEGTRQRSATITLTVDDLKQLVPLAAIGGTVELEVPFVDADTPAFEAWCFDVGGGAAADDGAVGRCDDVEGEKPYLVSNSTADSTPVVVLVANDVEGGEG
jgi:hypothetical protein